MSMKTRVLCTSASVLTHRFEVGETPTDSTTPVTVTVTDPSGATVASGTATHGATGMYTYALPPQAVLTVLSVAWAATIGGAAVVETDTVEVAGGFLFTLSEGRASDASLSDRDKYPTSDLDAKRLEVEEEVERICDRAFVPRYARVVVDGTGSADLVLPHPDPDRTAAHIRTIRSVSMAQRSGGTLVPFTSTELAALIVRNDNTITRTDQWWAEGYGNVVIEYEYGLDGPALELKRAAMMRLRSLLNANKSSIPDRASSYTAGDGGTYRLDMPGAWKTGLPAVDAVYSRYSRRSGSGTGGAGRPIPASRTLDYDPQRNSLMHGGPR